MKEILSLNNKKAIGLDKIPASFLKIGRHVIAPYFNLFLQFIFNNGIYPYNCKIARVVPVYKNGDQTEINNYRPISILTCFSKIIEKLIYARFINFFRKHDVIYPKQYEFQKKVSTTHAVLDMVTTIYDNIYEKLFSGLLLIDLRKAFDTVCHQTLLIKTEHYAIRGVAYNLVNSYLHDRKQFVALNQTCSKTNKIQYGVPQGSSLGPLFFLIYIKDLKTAVNCNPRLFADDTCLIVTAPSISLLQKKN